MLEYSKSVKTSRTECHGVPRVVMRNFSIAGFQYSSVRWVQTSRECQKLLGQDIRLHERRWQLGTIGRVRGQILRRRLSKGATCANIDELETRLHVSCVNICRKILCQSGSRPFPLWREYVQSTDAQASAMAEPAPSSSGQKSGIDPSIGDRTASSGHSTCRLDSRDLDENEPAVGHDRAAGPARFASRLSPREAHRLVGRAD